jgi:hypothetical protein
LQNGTAIISVLRCSEPLFSIESVLTIGRFCGFMYLTAALCLWALRAWKIGQLESDSQHEASGEGRKPSGIVARLFKLRKV